MLDNASERPLNSEWDMLAERPKPKGRPILAWVAIGFAVTSIVLMQNRTPAGAPDEAGTDPAGIALVQMGARWLVGAADLAGGIDGDVEQIAPFNEGTFGQRLRFVILAGELAGPQEALLQLEELDLLLAEHEVELRPVERRLQGIVLQLYADYAAGRWEAPNLGADDRTLLQHELRWFGALALAPARSPNHELRRQVIGAAHSAVFAMLGLLGWFGFLGLSGLAGLALFLARLANGSLESGLRGGSGNGALYAETFAVWLVLFLGLNLVVEPLDLGDSKLFGMGLAMAGSLIALAWPAWRGADWRQVRQDIGWTAGRRPLAEPFFGLGCYAMSLPIAAVVMACTLVALLLLGSADAPPAPAPDPFRPSPLPTHPVIEMIGAAGWWGPIQLLFVAAVVAPIVEETAFRGVLYRHLRELTASGGGAISIALSIAVNSLLFAIVHPQGPIAVPALMTLAAGFSVAREWRGSLVPSIVAHAANNAAIMLMLILCMR